MKIFIKGLASFLGSNLGIRLANEGHEIYGNGNKLTPNTWKKKLI